VNSKRRKNKPVLEAIIKRKNDTTIRAFTRLFFRVEQIKPLFDVAFHALQNAYTYMCFFAIFRNDPYLCDDTAKGVVYVYAFEKKINIDDREAYENK
jgi:hypothetical protein